MQYSSYQLSKMPQCDLWPKRPDRCHTVITLQNLFSAISFICLFFVIGIIILFKLYKFFVQRLILFLCLSALFKVIMLFIKVDVSSHGVCVFQGFMSQFFSWAELLWVCAITGNIILVVHGYQSSKYEKYFHIFVWGFSLFWSVIPLFGNHYGPAGSWCWINREDTGLRFGVWFIPFILVIVLMIVAYVHLFIYAYRSSAILEGSQFEMEQQKALRRKEVAPLLAYPILYFVLSLPMLIYRIDDAAKPNEQPDYTLLVLSVIASPLTGTFNAIAYAFLEDTLKESFRWSYVKNAFLSCCFESSHVTHNYDVIDEHSDRAGLQSSTERRAEDTGYGTSDPTV